MLLRKQRRKQTRKAKCPRFFLLRLRLLGVIDRSSYVMTHRSAHLRKWEWILVSIPI